MRHAWIFAEWIEIFSDVRMLNFKLILKLLKIAEDRRVLRQVGVRDNKLLFI